ncbi:MAG: DUF4176 domain-containing protein [Bacilli bacterium]|jgi:hypothetical protein|nr:DUF4176 domain-containing protein [Clostridium sp.]MDY3798459.1 DUF4176 domain-containing protein [Bacilli bacterium]
MNNIGEKYLPLGTVVLLEGGTKRVMITGFATASSDDPDLIYDYAGCMYPQGFITSNQTVLFDHDQIQKIYHFGLIDPEWVEFQDNLKKFLENLDEQDISAFGANINNTQVGVGPVGVNTNYNAMQANSINTGVGSLGFNQNFANSNPQANYINNTSAQSNSQNIVFNGQNVTQSNLSQSNLNNMINNTNLNNNLQNTGVASNQINQNNVSGQS